MEMQLYRALEKCALHAVKAHPETDIDRNVFNGSREDWELWFRNHEESWNYRPGWGMFGESK